YKFSNEKREQTQWNNLQHRVVARDMAKKSIVLLKNEKQVLPISKQTGSIALIGPFVKAKSDHLGFWSYDWPDDSTRIVSLWEGVKAKVSPSTKMLYAKGCGITELDKTGFAEAVATARKADYVILTIGETRDMSGEAKSRSSIQLPGVQEELVKEIVALGKPTVVMISAGRPLVFNWTADHAPAILYTWWLGTEAGNAMADVLFGDYNPSGKLPMSFPRTEGQIPIYYNHYNTGRPAKNDSDRHYRSAYTDLSIYPKYAFGHGLSYSNFDYSDITLSAPSFTAAQSLTATVTLTNKSTRPGTETVQLYIRDITGSVVRPVKELKGFQQVYLKEGESKVISFTLTANDLRFYNDQLQYIYEPGEFKLFIGSSSDMVKEVGFELK
ncbi:MAG: glycoside hydrolase family 3 C-terminal domain-containing protein, partial [Chitinophagaceae bacterium]|nr:glycoside hydrolase family 3 C-terminal domain-containing protein [Chitinophagaceae bacterium]